jgi:MraZ protein
VAATFDTKKARISVPSSFRGTLAAQGSPDLIARRANHSPCIEIWPKTVFEAEVTQRQAGLDPFSREYETLMRRLLAHAHALTPDIDGRVVLPRELIDKAELDADVVFSGRHSFFQLWSRRRWEEALAEDAAEGAAA